MPATRSLTRQRVYATADWVTPPGQWWGTIGVTIANYEGAPLVDPEIVFEVAADQTVTDNYGLVWNRRGNTITGRFVPEKRTIPGNGGTQSFTLGVSRAVAGVGPLPANFKVNGESADPGGDDEEPPSTPEHVVIDSVGPRSFTASWEPSTDNVAVSHYDVMVARADVDEPINLTVKTNTVTVSGLVPETEYGIIVQAIDVAGNHSGLSKSVRVTTAAPTPDNGDWDLPRAPFLDYTSWPTPKIAPIAEQTGCDGVFLGFGTSPSGATTPQDKKIWWAGLTRGMYDGVEGTEHPGDMSVSTYQKNDLAAFRGLGGRVAVSLGGASNVPIEDVETDIGRIVAAYEGLIENYGITHLDMDFEGAFIHNYPGQDRHIAAITRVMQTRRDVKLSYTLPVDGAPGSLEGFNDGGLRLLRSLADGGIEPALVNGMLMEFGATAPPSLFDASVIALNAMHGQIAGIWTHWDSDQVWRRMGACPMFGQNNNGKKFYVDDMRKLVEFCREHEIGCLSGWDVSRDDPAKSGVEQEPLEFTKVLSTYEGPRPVLPLVVTKQLAAGDRVVGAAFLTDDGGLDLRIDADR